MYKPPWILLNGLEATQPIIIWLHVYVQEKFWVRLVLHIRKYSTFFQQMRSGYMVLQSNVFSLLWGNVLLCHRILGFELKNRVWIIFFFSIPEDNIFINFKPMLQTTKPEFVLSLGSTILPCYSNGKAACLERFTSVLFCYFQ